MKYCAVIILMFFSAMHTTNAAELISGSLDSLINEPRLSVSLDCSKCIYRVNSKKLPFDFFLAKASRDVDWEQKSLAYFVENFNEVLVNVGWIAFDSAQKPELRYELIITPLSIDKNGNIKAGIYVKDKLKAEIIATIYFKSEGDDDDSVTLRDPLRAAGKDVGKLFKKILNKAANGQKNNYRDDIYN